MTDDDLDYWPLHVQKMFSAIGRVMDEKRLRPETLVGIPTGFGSILPDHQVNIEHISGEHLGRRKGHYVLTVEGPIFAGRWRFMSGKLEKLSLAARKRFSN